MSSPDPEAASLSIISSSGPGRQARRSPRGLREGAPRLERRAYRDRPGARLGALRHSARHRGRWSRSGRSITTPTPPTPQPGFGGRKGYPAARPRPWRHQPDQRHDLYARPAARITTPGRRRAASAGAGRTCSPYFKRSEDNARGADAWHGVGGPLKVSDLSYRNPAIEAFVEAAVQAGFSRNADFNGPVQEGVGAYQVFQHDGRRCNAARAYLEAVAGAEPDRLSPTARRGGSCSRTGARSACVCEPGRRRASVCRPREEILSAPALSARRNF